MTPASASGQQDRRRCDAIGPFAAFDRLDDLRPRPETPPETEVVPPWPAVVRSRTKPSAAGAARRFRG